MRYLQGDGVNTSLSRLVLYARVSSLYFVSCALPRHGHVLSGTIIIKILSVNQLYLQG